VDSLSAIPLIVLENEKKIDHDILEFEKSQNGNFDSFAYLVNKHGKYRINRVVFKVKKQETEIGGCFFRIQENRVYYDIYDKNCKEQENFGIQDFERLISIIY
jgi:hypothetical protein